MDDSWYTQNNSAGPAPVWCRPAPVRCRCCLGCTRCACTLAPRGKNDWTVCVWWRCGLMSNYFDHLFLVNVEWQHECLHSFGGSAFHIVCVCMLCRWMELTCRALLMSRQQVHWKVLAMWWNWSPFTGQKVCSLPSLILLRMEAKQVGEACRDYAVKCVTPKVGPNVNTDGAFQLFCIHLNKVRRWCR